MPATQLTTTQLGNTGLEITSLGFGAWAIGGGGWEFGWGSQDDDESIAAIHRALEQGINWIDTAAAYGFGRSERIVGRALEGVAERPYVFTKCSLLERPDRTVAHNLKRDSILREAEGSVERLGVDAIDLYQIHWPIPAEDIEEAGRRWRNSACPTRSCARSAVASSGTGSPSAATATMFHGG